MSVAIFYKNVYFSRKKITNSWNRKSYFQKNIRLSGQRNLIDF